MESMRDQNIMSCIDLSKSSEPVHGQLAGLCTVCEQINFVAATNNACAGHRDGPHFHIGPLRNVVTKDFCPGCRLILSAAKSMKPTGNTFYESKVTIQPRFIYVHPSEQNDDLEEKGVENSSSHLLPHMERLVEVILGDSKVAGTVIRAKERKESELINSTPTLHFYENESLRGQMVPPEVNIDYVKQWMHSCVSKHKKCHKPSVDPINMQAIRLIDVQDFRIIRAGSAYKTLPYVALSYVWGAKATPLLSQDNLSQYASPQGLRCLDIPRTVADAIRFTKMIGKRYLWVDALCIIQDDEGDKQQQLPIMDSIFSCAELVLVAAAGHDAFSGLPGVGDTKRWTSQRIEVIDGTQFITAQPQVREILEQSVWNGRGWTFQEAMLPRRVVVFTDSQVYWACRVTACREDFDTNPSVFEISLTSYNSLSAHLLKPNICRTLLYSQLASEYSGRTLKDKSDVLWAFLGILKLMTSRFQSGFIWGLPLERLDATLLWRQTCAVVHPRRAHHIITTKSSLHDLSYPSWSWLSIDGDIKFQDECGDGVISQVTWHEPLRLDIEIAAARFKENVKSNKDLRRSRLLFESVSELDISQYGLLHFTAQTATLPLRHSEQDIQQEDKGNGKGAENEGETIDAKYGANAVNSSNASDGAVGNADETLSRENGKTGSEKWAAVTIHAPDGQNIGRMLGPHQLLTDEQQDFGEFVILSSNARAETDKACSYQEEGLDRGSIKHKDKCSHIEGYNVMLIDWVEGIAYRRGLGLLTKEGFEKIETVTKTIILG